MTAPPRHGLRTGHGDLSALRGRTWDAVLDTFSDPEAVAATAALLSGSAGAYGYVSGMSVYHPDGPMVPGAGDPVRHEGEAADGDPLQERSLVKLAAEAVVAERFGAPAPVWFRPVEQTARDVLAQLAAEGRTELVAGLEPARERALVAGRPGARRTAVRSDPG